MPPAHCTGTEGKVFHVQHRLSRRALVGAVSGLVGLGAVLALSGCAASKPEIVRSDDSADAVVTVRVYDNVYDPAEVEIQQGEAVRWVFEGPADHDVVAEDESFVSDLVTEGSYTHVFTETGSFSYDCSIHPEMRGVVKVVAP